MARDPLALLARLERDELDRRRRELASAEQTLEGFVRRRAAADAASRAALEARLQDDAALDILAGTVEGNRKQSNVLAGNIAEQRKVVETTRSAMREKLAVAKGYELIAERRRKAALAKAEAREQAEIEELVIMRHNR